MAAEHFVRYETDDRVAVITLDRPEAANAQTPGILKDLDDAWRRADEDPDVRVIVLPTTGKHFSAGHDMSGNDPSADGRNLRPKRTDGKLVADDLLRLGDPGLPGIRQALARHPETHHRRGAGQVHRRGADAVLAVRPHRRRGQRAVLRPGRSDGHHGRRIPRPHLGIRAPESQGDAVHRKFGDRRGGAAHRDGQPRGAVGGTALVHHAACAIASPRPTPGRCAWPSGPSTTPSTPWASRPRSPRVSTCITSGHTRALAATDGQTVVMANLERMKAAGRGK